MTKKLAFIGGVVFLLVSLFLFRNDLGVLIWQHFRLDTTALTLAPHDQNLKRDIASYYFGGGSYDFKKAQHYYEELYASGDRDGEVLYQLGRIRFVDNDFKGAVVVLDEQLERHPEKKRAYYVKGLAFLYDNNFTQAQEAFEIFVEAHPDEWAGYNDLAWAYVKGGMYTDALWVAKEGLVQFPDNMWLHNMAGVALWNLGNLSEAHRLLLEASELITKMSLEEWSRAYPGNDPGTHAETFATMKYIVEGNLKGVEEEMGG